MRLGFLVSVFRSLLNSRHNSKGKAKSFRIPLKRKINPPHAPIISGVLLKSPHVI